MKLYPAMDFKGGKCVRLYQGDEHLSTTFDYSPVKWALQCEADGAQILHMIDLDGAFTGTGRNLALLKEAQNAVSIPIQIGGGIRSALQASELLDLGFQVILGTLLLKDPQTVKELLKRYPNQLIASIDCKNQQVTSEGWTQTSARSALDFIEEWVSCGFKKIIYTDVYRDGTLNGPNLDELASLVALQRRLTPNISFELVASGGVGNLSDLLSLKQLGVQGAIVGKALLEEKFTLKEALEVCHAD